ncbi:hypothetical protein AVEN_163392-1, partial [Araneus ventricosus]
RWGMDIRAILDTTFPNRWIDVTPLNFFFWGYAGDQVYSKEICDVEDLCASITTTIATTADMAGYPQGY